MGRPRAETVRAARRPTSTGQLARADMRGRAAATWRAPRQATWTASPSPSPGRIRGRDRCRCVCVRPRPERERSRGQRTVTGRRGGEGAWASTRVSVSRSAGPAGPHSPTRQGRPRRRCYPLWFGPVRGPGCRCRPPRGALPPCRPLGFLGLLVRQRGAGRGTGSVTYYYE